MKLQQILTAAGINAKSASEVRALIAIRLLHAVDKNNVISVARFDHRIVLDSNTEELDRVVSFSGMNIQIVHNPFNSRNDLDSDKIITLIQSDDDVVSHLDVEAAGAAVDGCVGASLDNHGATTLLDHNNIVVPIVTRDDQVSILQCCLHIACSLCGARLVYSRDADKNTNQPGYKLAIQIRAQNFLPVGERA